MNCVAPQTMATAAPTAEEQEAISNAMRIISEKTDRDVALQIDALLAVYDRRHSAQIHALQQESATLRSELMQERARQPGSRGNDKKMDLRHKEANEAKPREKWGAKKNECSFMEFLTLRVSPPALWGADNSNPVWFCSK